MKLAVACTFALGFAATAARADSTPWSQGVTEQQKADSRVLLDAGNALFLEKKYPEALEKYRAAVAIWDHPAIRFNIVRCLVLLDKPVEAAENLELALKYGAAPLEDKVYTDALAYQKLLANLSTFVHITCTQPNVALTLDGKPIGTCPTDTKQRVSTGMHQIVGTGEGLLPKTFPIVGVGGQVVEANIALEKFVRAGKVVHRWPAYVPWLVFGGGFALAGAGALFLSSAHSQIDSYDLIVDQRCSSHTCSADELADVQDLKDGASTKNALGTSLVVAGGAAVVSGAVMLYLNRGRTVYDEGPVLAPTVTPGGGGVSLTGSF